MTQTMKERTKTMFAENLIEMLKDTSFDKIRVTELAKRSGATPQTFYYHFKDKYELIAWMYLRDFADVTGGAEAEYSAERLTAIMQKLNEKRAFYRKVFSADSQNSISNYVRQLSLDLARDALKQSGKEGTLTEEQEMSISYHAYGILGMLQEWMLSKEPMDTFILANFMYSKTPDFLKESFAQMEYQSDVLMQNNL